MSNTRLYVGGISDEVKREHLEDLFGKHGKCCIVGWFVKIWTGYRKPGFAFINFESEHAASDAVEALNGEELMGRKLRVEASRSRSPVGRGGRGGPSRDGGRGRGRVGNGDAGEEQGWMELS